MRSGRTRGQTIALLAAVVVVLGLVVWARYPTDERQAAPGSRSDPSATASGSAGPGSSGRSRSGLPEIAVADLPVQARQTIALIDRGGPFPYRQDGQVFRNAERRLPDQPRGYYREYTVPTPGSPDRGARRLIQGRDTTLYWTVDHYDSFREVRR